MFRSPYYNPALQAKRSRTRKKIRKKIVALHSHPALEVANYNRTLRETLLSSFISFSSVNNRRGGILKFEFGVRATASS
jgi:hypothetical protein